MIDEATECSKLFRESSENVELDETSALNVSSSFIIKDLNVKLQEQSLEIQKVSRLLK